MAPHWFSPPVTVRSSNSGARYNCNNVEGAARELMEWNNHGPKWNQAVRACMSCFAGEMTTKDVREAFMDAAEEEGKLLLDHY